ncbi:MAG: TolC family protein [Parvularculaceae bacterium]|nr:TolC family protein [Parvularculaceae bacterium]
MRLWRQGVAVAAALALAPAALAAAEATTGSLYPSDVSRTALATALGGSAYILDDIGPHEDFAAAVRRAVGLHPLYHQEVSRRDEARAAIRAGRAALYPRLSASLSGDYVVAREFGAGTDNVVESLRNRSQMNAGVTASQLLFDGGATFARINEAKAQTASAEKSIDARVNELALGALSAFHDLATHQAVMKAGEEFIARHERLLADIKERQRLGAGTQADVMQASARLAAARARVAHIRESLRFAEIRYKEYFGREPLRLRRPSYEAVAVGSRDEAAALAVERHPEIGIAAARLDEAQAAHKAAKAARLPEIRAQMNAVKYDAFEGSDDYDVRAGVNLNYDIFSGGARGAAVAQAAARARQQSYDEARVRQEVEREAMIAFERREACNERLAALADALIANAEARRLISERFRAARGELIDVLQAENDYFEASVAYLAGLADRDMATYGLMEHTGDLIRLFSPQADHDDGGD